MSNKAGISPFFEMRSPSRQTIADIFRDNWHAALPDGIESGESPLFEDGRPKWMGTQIPGGFQGKSVLELGPLEGYQTYLMIQNGAREVVSVESNSINFLKCLCVKEIFGLSLAKFEFGDIVCFVRDCNRKFDIVWASGVLYHLQDPVYFIERAAQLAEHVYVWTHYFDDATMAALSNGQEKHFVRELDAIRQIGARSITLHARSYAIPDYRKNIPLRWQGGPEQITYWLSKPDIFWLFERAGMSITRVGSDNTTVNGLPTIDFMASRERIPGHPAGCKTEQ